MKQESSLFASLAADKELSAFDERLCMRETLLKIVVGNPQGVGWRPLSRLGEWFVVKLVERDAIRRMSTKKYCPS